MLLTHCSAVLFWFGSSEPEELVLRASPMYGLDVLLWVGEGRKRS